MVDGSVVVWVWVGPWRLRGLFLVCDSLCCFSAFKVLAKQRGRGAQSWRAYSLLSSLGVKGFGLSMCGPM